ncbi:hypothetical protein Poly59_59170 [Rubripirellula reticaptiva]|uniref:Uncharacterized protein n=1 Tax=Rubripirellula reticaptiva TaxID=2528013 RepID=A0A5C6EB27_9BACT|nr:hypothetical protein Poly59_59170 [Rubripirellula reticaptiva]
MTGRALQLATDVEKFPSANGTSRVGGHCWTFIFRAIAGIFLHRFVLSYGLEVEYSDRNIPQRHAYEKFSQCGEAIAPGIVKVTYRPCLFKTPGLESPGRVLGGVR